MTNPTTLKQRYHDVKQRIAAAATKAGRNPREIMLVAVTKYAQPEQIRGLIELGHADFGESRVQNLAKRVAAIDEFLERHRTLTSSRVVKIPEKVRWHMIGHLQRNKVKKVTNLVALIHSVDTLRLAEEIQDAAVKLDHPVDVLIQINASHEDSKYGCAIAAVQHLAELVDTMVGLRVRGMMTMAPNTPDTNQIRATFERCRDTFEEIRKTEIGEDHFNILSMGMSQDYELAIEYGANVVRIGSAIFGPRRTVESAGHNADTESADDDESDPPSPTVISPKHQSTTKLS